MGDNNREYDLGLAMINLQLAMQNNNLDIAKELVTFLNTNYYLNEEEDNTNKFILENCIDFYNAPKNETFKYVLDNLNYNFNQSEDQYWTLLVNYYELNLGPIENKNEIIYQELYDFIVLHINDNNLSIKRYNDLIRLIYLIQDYSLLQQLKVNLEGSIKGVE